MVSATQKDNGDEQAASPGRRIWIEVWDTVRAVGVAVIVALLIKQFLINTYTVDGPSMEPNFHTGERVLVLRAAYDFGTQPQPGQVIVFKPPISSPDDFIKRVIAVGPATVRETPNGQIYVNGALQPEPFIYPPYRAPAGGYPTTEVWRVPAGDVFVMGDHRTDSEDSRVFGPVSEKAIAGRVLLVWWPLADFHAVSS